MALVFVRMILYLGLLLGVMSVIAVVIVPKDSPGVVPAVLALGFNLITVAGATVALRLLLKREERMAAIEEALRNEERHEATLETQRQQEQRARGLPEIDTIHEADR